jgi:hypothetical protein
MTFAERMRGFINKSVGVSSDLSTKARGKAKDLGAMGVLKLEIMRLQSQAAKLIAKLGSEVYVMLVDKNHTTVSRETASIRGLLTEIERVRARIELKEKEYRSISTKKKAAR